MGLEIIWTSSGFENDLTTIIEALDMRYGKGQSTDRIQQEFYQLSQERGETIQQFAGRMELKDTRNWWSCTLDDTQKTF